MNLFASGSWDKTIRIWSYSSENGQQCVNELKGHLYSVKHFEFLADRNHLISGSNDKTIRVWDLNNETGTCLKVMECRHDGVTCVKYNETTKDLISCSWDETFNIWNVDTGECEQTLKAESPLCSFELCLNIWN